MKWSATQTSDKMSKKFSRRSWEGRLTQVFITFWHDLKAEAVIQTSHVLCATAQAVAHWQTAVPLREIVKALFITPLIFDLSEIWGKRANSNLNGMLEFNMLWMYFAWFDKFQNNFLFLKYKVVLD